LVREGLGAGAVAGVLSGLPSTVHAVLAGRPLLASSAAAGTLLLDDDRSQAALVLAGAAAHACLSLGWGAVLEAALPERPSLLSGVAAGLAIAALDLGVVGRRQPAIRALPAVPQVLDHAAYGLVVALVLRRRPQVFRRQRA
jgi:hypothetical protein